MSPSQTANALLSRCSTFLVGWVPDLSSVPWRRQAAIAGGVSLLLHLVLLLVLIIGALVSPARRDLTPAGAPSASNLEVVVQPPTTALAAKPEPERMQMIDPRGMEASPEKPKDAKFESDQDMVAGSEGKDKGLLPLPSQEGREDFPSQDFATQQVQLGLNAPPAPAAPEDTRVSLRPDANSAPPSPTPLYTPQPIAKPDLAKADAAQPTEPLPEPARQAKATPPPRPQVDKPAPDQLAFAAPRATPVPVAPPASSAAAAQREKTYQQLLQKSRVEGQISNRRKAGVDAIATPAGRWWKLTQNAIGSNWYLFTNQLGDMVTVGRVEVSFKIDASGTVRNIRLENSSGNHALENACVRAIKETRIPKPPADMMEQLQNSEFERVITFTYF